MLLWTSCDSQFDKDEELILEYLETNNLTAERTENGIYYIIDVEGTGDNPTVNDEVEVHYEGYFLDGEIFDSSIERNETSTFPLSNVIVGWQLGIPLLKEGGKGKLLIPSIHAYGASGRGAIPRNAVLIFDIELFEIK